jgi:long-chain acyl-CoA synthetase
VVVRDALPKTMIGKLSRKDLLAEIMAERTPA